jgi:cation transport regulator ChaC
VYGVAYLVPKADVVSVSEYLTWREKAGYDLVSATFHPGLLSDYNNSIIFADDPSESPFELQVYISLANKHGTDEHFTGGEPMETIAKTVKNLFVFK